MDKVLLIFISSLVLILDTNFYIAPCPEYVFKRLSPHPKKLFLDKFKGILLPKDIFK